MMLPSIRMRVLVSTQPVDFRKGPDGLAAIVSSVLREDPFTGTVFVFRSRRDDRLKLLYLNAIEAMTSSISCNSVHVPEITSGQTGGADMIIRYR